MTEGHHDAESPDGGRRERLSAAFEAVGELKLWDANEATTRVRTVDEVLRVLGWDRDSTEFEARSGGGDFLDYLLRWAGEPWLVVEAKRINETFHVDPAAFPSDRSHVRAVKGLMSKGGENLRRAMNQAAGYANARAVPFCAVTNGAQWIFFRGLSAPRAPWTEGRALVFLSPEEVLARFDDFMDCLGRDGRRSEIVRLLEQPTLGELPEPIIPAEVLRFKRRPRDDEDVARIAAISSYMLADIHSDDRLEMLDRCYVSPNLTSDFDTSIARLLKDSAEHVEGGDAEVLDGDVDDFARTVTWREKIGLKHPVVVVGNIGAGKTTFIHRAFRKLKVDRLAFPAIIDLEGFGRAGTFNAADEHRKVAERVLEGLQRSTKGVLRGRDDLDENAKRHGDPFHMATLRTLCHRPLDEAREVARSYWAKHEDEWGLKVLEVVEKYRENPVGWLVHFIRHLRHRLERPDGLRYPVLLAIDNIDQADSDYQKCVYGLAQQLARDTPAIVVFCIREDTYREGRHPQGFLSSTPLSFVFHVKTPGLDHVLRRRLDFARAHLLNASRSVQLGEASDAVPVWCDRLERNLLANRSAGAELVGALAGQNMRAALDMTGRVVASGVEAATTGGATAAVLQGLLSVSTPRTMTERVGLANVFDAEPAVPVPHALRLRLLAYLHGTSKLAHARPLEERSEVVVARFGAWGYRTVLVREALLSLLRSGLVCDAQNRASPATGLPSRIGLTASGYVHLMRLSRERQFRFLMACAGRWYDRELAERFIERCQGAGSDDGCTFGDLLESTADDFFEAYLKARYQAENAQLVDLADHRWTRDVLSVTASIFSGTIERPRQSWQESPSAADGAARPGPTLFPGLGAGANDASAEKLGRIPRDLASRGTVWVPRILWALEWTRRQQKEPASPKEMSEALAQHGDIDVPHNNISRAFRDLKKADVSGLWVVTGKRYAITSSGTALLISLVESDVR
ncbi:MAG: hypothetical protein V4850_23715 [Myxococcota bacterium]